MSAKHRMCIGLLILAACDPGLGIAKLRTPPCGTEAIVDEPHFHLETTLIGETSTTALSLQNVGDGPFRVEAISTSCPWASDLRLPDARFEVGPGETRQMEVGYAPIDPHASGRPVCEITFALSNAQVDELVAYPWPGDSVGNLRVPETLELGETTVGSTIRGELLITNPTDIAQQFGAAHVNPSFSPQLTLVEGQFGTIGAHETHAVVVEYEARLEGSFSWRIDVGSAGSLVGTVTVTGSAYRR